MAQFAGLAASRLAPVGIGKKLDAISALHSQHESTPQHSGHPDSTASGSRPRAPRPGQMNPATHDVGSHARGLRQHADGGISASHGCNDGHPNGHANLQGGTDEAHTAESMHSSNKHELFGRPSTHSTDYYGRDAAGLGGDRDYPGQEDEGYDRMNGAARYAGEDTDGYGRHEQEFNRYGQESQDHQEHGFLGQRHGLGHYQGTTHFGNDNDLYRPAFEFEGHNGYDYNGQYDQGYGDHDQQGQDRGNYDHYERGYGGLGAGGNDQYSQQLY